MRYCWALGMRWSDVRVHSTPRVQSRFPQHPRLAHVIAGAVARAPDIDGPNVW